jgi:hypothetical protein
LADRPENWRDIPGYEGRYQVSDLGRVRSVARSVLLVNRFGRPERRNYAGQILKPGPMTKQGHLSVALGKGNSQCVHTLVLSTFVGERPPGFEGRHVNGDASDNRLSNLAWGSRTANNIDVTLHGRRKLTVDQVRVLRTERAAGKTNAEIAAGLGVSESLASAVFVGRLYKHVR